jgi:hypothetical protein
MSCGNSRSSKCNPCGPNEAAMNAIADRAAYYARIAQYASDSFSQVYLGAKDVAPTVDNNGNPLVEGALYFNTVDGLLYVWYGTAWVPFIGAEVVTINDTQTITGQKTFTQNIIGNVVGDIFASNGTTKILENGTGSNATLTGNVIGDVTGNVTGNLIGNAATATTLQTARTIGITGSVTGTATSFDGSANITIPATITTGATITSPIFAGTATGGLTTNVVQGVTDGIIAAVGYIGEVISATSSLNNIGSNSIENGASITLTAGDWEVYGSAELNFSSVTASAGDALGAAISLTSLNLPANQRQKLLMPAISSVNSQSPAFAFVTPRVRFNVTVNTLVYIVVQSPSITSGTMTFSSIITANRVR